MPLDCRAGKSRLYHTWRNMVVRCRDPRARDFERYGGRGIRVCEEWESYSRFRDWAISSGYRDDLQIDRVDTERGYNPVNCRWVTCLENNRNKSNNHRLTALGETKPLASW